MDEDGFTLLKIHRHQLLHGLGSLLMWGSVPLALLNVYYMEAFPDWFVLNFIACFIVALVGAVLKKRYCPHCRVE